MSDVVILSGCSSGFGLHAAVHLARRGLRVVATMRDPGKRERLDRAAAAAGVAIDLVQLDVADGRSIDRCVAEVTERHGRIAGLVNNAGYGVGGFVHDLTMEEIRAQFETNFFGLVALTKAVLPGMIERRRGRIVNVSSIGGRVALPIIAAYCASKFAVEGFSESLRYELLPFGVHVCLVEPGSFRTEIFEANRRMAARAYDERSPFFPMAAPIEARLAKLLRHYPTDLTPVSGAIHRALTARRPPFRQAVGKDALAQGLARALLPQRLFDAAVLSQIRPKG